jgi:glyoxylase-like metal-dependent hydrolase (beta-lactamase superfamily II)
MIAVTQTLWAVQIPIPYPMKFVTVLIDTAEPVTLVDCALDTPEARASLETALHELNLEFGDIARIIVTHHHPDHYGLAGWIQGISNCEVLMLELDILRGASFWNDWENWLERHVRHFAKHGLPIINLEEVRIESRATRHRVHAGSRLTPLQAGDRLALGGRSFEVLWMPGHADGHLTLWDGTEKLLIAGDVILEHITPNVGLWANSRENPLLDYLNSLEHVMRLNPSRAVVGHYGPVIENAATRAQEIVAHHHARLDELRAQLETPMNAFEASFILFARELNSTGRRFALTETLAHLEYLHQNNELLRLTGDVIRYAKTQ